MTLQGNFEFKIERMNRFSDAGKFEWNSLRRKRNTETAQAYTATIR